MSFVSRICSKPVVSFTCYVAGAWSFVLLCCKPGLSPICNLRFGCDFDFIYHPRVASFICFVARLGVNSICCAARFRCDPDLLCNAFDARCACCGASSVCVFLVTGQAGCEVHMLRNDVAMSSNYHVSSYVTSC